MSCQRHDWGIVTVQCLLFAENQCEFATYLCTIPPSRCSRPTLAAARPVGGSGCPQESHSLPPTALRLPFTQGRLWCGAESYFFNRLKNDRQQKLTVISACQNSTDISKIVECSVGVTIGRPAILEQNCIVIGDYFLFSSKTATIAPQLLRGRRNAAPTVSNEADGF